MIIIPELPRVIGTPEEKIGILTRYITQLQETLSVYINIDIDRVEAAQSKAEAAQTAAETAQAAAEEARDAAEIAQVSAEIAQGKAEAARDAAGTAEGMAEIAQDKAEAARDAAKSAAVTATAGGNMAKSWAVGGTGTREGENTNNARYWAEQAQNAAGGT